MTKIAEAAPLWAALCFCAAVLLFSAGLISDHDARTGKAFRFYVVGCLFLALTSALIVAEALNHGAERMPSVHVIGSGSVAPFRG